MIGSVECGVENDVILMISGILDTLTTINISHTHKAPPFLFTVIAALKPIVGCLFLSPTKTTPSPASFDGDSEIETQREVVNSMLMKLIKYPKVSLGSY